MAMVHKDRISYVQRQETHGGGWCTGLWIKQSRLGTIGCVQDWARHLTLIAPLSTQV